MTTYRGLTEKEKSILESQHCHSSDWCQIEVAENFTPYDIHNVTFDGPVRIGSMCRMRNVGIIRTTDDATFGDGITISVLNEGGDGNVIIYHGLTAQMAAFMVRHSHDHTLWEALRAMIRREVDSLKPICTTICDNVTIYDTREITNAMIGDSTEIAGASRLAECTLNGGSDASILVSDGVICDNCIIGAGASLTDYAKLYDCYVGEACHIGRGFTAENSLFFANSHMDNGEACAALCGPFSVSHHKSSLLIGGEYSFYNAGSGTNFSNHAYKMGPIHWGVLMRGSKTASGAHTLWPARIGPFSMVMGKVASHPDASQMPFSYIIAQGETTWLVPGRNLTTVGTYRDINKWPKRDRRPRGRRTSLVEYDWLNPMTIGLCVEGRNILERIRREMGDNAASYNWNGMYIKNSSLHKGIRLYNMAIRLGMLKALEEHEPTLPMSASGTGTWTDMLGMLVPETEINSLAEDIRSGILTEIEDVTATIRDMFQAYSEYKWTWFYSLILKECNIDSLTHDDAIALKAQLTRTREEWTAAIKYDAEKEYAMGDVDEDTLNDFVRTIE